MERVSGNWRFMSRTEALVEPKARPTLSPT